MTARIPVALAAASSAGVDLLINTRAPVERPQLGGLTLSTRRQAASQTKPTISEVLDEPAARLEDDLAGVGDAEVSYLAGRATDNRFTRSRS